MEHPVRPDVMLVAMNKVMAALVEGPALNLKDQATGL
jgi:hypothetical protein